MDTVKARKSHQISLGYGPKDEIIQVVSAHANFVAYFAAFFYSSSVARIDGPFTRSLSPYPRSPFCGWSNSALSSF